MERGESKLNTRKLVVLKIQYRTHGQTVVDADTPSSAAKASCCLNGSV